LPPAAGRDSKATKRPSGVSTAFDRSSPEAFRTTLCAFSRLTTTTWLAEVAVEVWKTTKRPSWETEGWPAAFAIGVDALELDDPPPQAGIAAATRRRVAARIDSVLILLQSLSRSGEAALCRGPYPKRHRYSPGGREIGSDQRLR
jgi:hypothetical protein